MMTPSGTLAAHRQQIRDAARRFNVANPRVFGSVARGSDGPLSDVDIVVDTLPATTLFDLAGLQLELQQLLGRKVDLVTAGGLPPAIREHVLSEALAL